mgnify:CR=1 FL=1
MTTNKQKTLRSEIEEILDEVVKLTTRNFGHPVPKVNREIFYKDAINATDKILQATRKRVPKKIKMPPKRTLSERRKNLISGYNLAIDQINKELE